MFQEMREPSEIEELIDKLYEYHDKCNKDDEMRWRCSNIKTQIDVLEWVLELQKTEDVFDLGEEE